MIRCQRQVNRATAQHRKNAGIQRRCFFQAHPDHRWYLEAFQQWAEALLDRPCLSVQLSVGQHTAGNVQRRSCGEGEQAGLQSFDHRHLRCLQQLHIGGVIEPMHERQCLQLLQAVFGPGIGAGRGGAILRVAGEAADQHGDPFHQRACRLQAQSLAIAAGRVGKVQHGQQALAGGISA